MSSTNFDTFLLRERETVTSTVTASNPLMDALDSNTYSESSETVDIDASSVPLNAFLPQFPLLFGKRDVQPHGSSTPRLAAFAPSFSQNDNPYDVCSEEQCVTQCPDMERFICDLDYREASCGFVKSRHHLSKLIQHQDTEPCPSEVSMSLPPKKPRQATEKASAGLRLNKFVRRLHDMICGEKNSGIVQWRRGLLVLLDTKVFAKQILPKYFNTRNFKTFRRQLNYYGFVHVRSYSNSGTKSTTALWVNQELATGKIEGEDDCTRHDLNNIASVLQLKRVEPCESVKTSEGRRVRKELAMSTIEEDLGVSAQSIQLQQFYVISEERPKIAADELFTVQPPIHINTPYLEHCNWSSASTPLVPERLKQESTVPTAATKDRRYMKASENSHYCLDTLNADNVEMKPPTSSTSVANLLLLLSSAG